AKIVVAQHHVCGGMVVFGPSVPDEHPVVAAVRDDDDVVVHVHASGSVQMGAGRAGRRQQQSARRGAPQPALGERGHWPPLGEGGHWGLTQTWAWASRTGNGSSCTWGTVRHSPLERSNRKPCHGHVMTFPSTRPPSNGLPMWGH